MPISAIIRDELQTFLQMPPLAGGWLVNHDIRVHKITGEIVLACIADTYAAYLWDDKAKRWRQLITNQSMPAADCIPGIGGGVYALTIAPSNPDVMYMVWNARVYRSDNRGGKWVRTNFPENQHVNPNDNQRMSGEKMAVDPKDSNHVILGTQDGGAIQTWNAGETWAIIQDISKPLDMNAADDVGVSGIVWGENGVVWAASHGRGYYRSTDNARSWQRPPGGPVRAPMHAAMTMAGVLLCTSYGANELWRFDGAWKQIRSPYIDQQGVATIACDPFDPNRVVIATPGGDIMQSKDAGASFNDIAWGGRTLHIADTEPVWMRKTNENYFSQGALRFHPTNRNRMIDSQGIGMWYGDVLPDSNKVTWHAMSNGIGQLCANQIMVTPTRNNIIVASWDRPVFKITQQADGTLTADHHIDDDGRSINHCTGVDYCASDDNIIAMVNFQSGSGVSRDGGLTMTQFETSPFPDFPDCGGGGEIAVGGPENYVWAATNNQGAVVTKNGGKGWKPCNLPKDLNWGYFLKRHILTADRVKPGVFTIAHATAGIFRSTDGGDNFNLVAPSPMPLDEFNCKMRSVPGKADHLLMTAGDVGGDDFKGEFIRSADGGKNWDAIPDILEVKDFGFGPVAPGETYPTVWIIGAAKGVFGIYRTHDWFKTLIRTGDGMPMGWLDGVVAIDGDKKVLDRCYVGFGGAGYAYAPGKAAAIPAPSPNPAPTVPGTVPAAPASLISIRANWAKVMAANRLVDDMLAQSLVDGKFQKAEAQKLAPLVKILLKRVANLDAKINTRV